MEMTEWCDVGAIAEDAVVLTAKVIPPGCIVFDTTWMRFTPWSETDSAPRWNTETGGSGPTIWPALWPVVLDCNESCEAPVVFSVIMFGCEMLVGVATGAVRANVTPPTV